VLVDNRPGAEGAVAMQALLAAPPDGHTLVIISAGSIILNPLTNPAIGYRLGDVRPLVGCAQVTGLFATGAASRLSSMRGALETAGREPGRITMGTYAGIYRMVAAGLERGAGVSLNHVPYKGLAPVTNDLAGGSLDLGLLDAGTAAPIVAAGKLRGLAVTSAQRLAALPDVPTLRELGLPPPGIGIWVGTGIHRATPEPLVERLEKAVQKALTAESWHALLRRLGSLEHWPVGTKEFASVVEADTTYFRANLHLLGPR
jgi:tripartite-type tricarboxylate transporter receptor subunit TctC